MAKEIKAFECGFCRKIYRSERGVNRHENFCTKNPINVHHCGMCKHFQVNRVVRHDNEEFGDVYGKQLRCGKFDRILYSAAMEGKGYLKKYARNLVGAMKMPSECGEFEGNWI